MSWVIYGEQIPGAKSIGFDAKNQMTLQDAPFSAGPRHRKTSDFGQGHFDLAAKATPSADQTVQAS
jgi:hypothetical protein